MVVQVMILEIIGGMIDQLENSMNNQLKHIAKDDIIKIEYVKKDDQENTYNTFYVFYEDGIDDVHTGFAQILHDVHVALEEFTESISEAFNYV